MKIDRDYVLAYLRKLKEQHGGYFGTDLSNLAQRSIPLPQRLNAFDKAFYTL
jgi:hypothetical protein